MYITDIFPASAHPPTARVGTIYSAKKKSSGDNSEKNRTAGRTKGARKTKRSTIKQPVTLELDIAELPEALRAGLNEEIRRKVKRRRINYDKLDRAGAVRWNIVCRIER